MAAVMMALGAIALLLAVVSIYALLSFLVTRRTREIGIRVALGARRGHLLAMVCGRTFALVAAGGGLGTILGVWIAGFQSVMLIRMPDVGVATPLIVFGALAAASVAAAWLPAARALSARPAQALNSD
jgi:ABC-type antimicrobial peptide transport system permease subunit